MYTQQQKNADYIKLYLDYLNNFLSVEAFAVYYHTQSNEKALRIINKGRVLHQDQFGHH